MSELRTLYEERSDELGVLRLCRWPEGFVLWCGGEIVWKSWEEISEHKKGDERTAAWRYCECRVCRELQEEENTVTVKVQPSEIFVPRIASVLSK